MSGSSAHDVFQLPTIIGTLNVFEQAFVFLLLSATLNSVVRTTTTKMKEGERARDDAKNDVKNSAKFRR